MPSLDLNTPLLLSASSSLEFADCAMSLAAASFLRLTDPSPFSREGSESGRAYSVSSSTSMYDLIGVDGFDFGVLGTVDDLRLVLFPFNGAFSPALVGRFEGNERDVCLMGVLEASLDIDGDRFGGDMIVDGEG